MHGPAGDVRELGHVATHVVAVRVEAPGLRMWIENAVRSRVDPGAGDPLPVAHIVRDVAIDEQVCEVRGAEAPVEREILCQEGGGEQSRAPVHPALARELPHAGVDDRHAGATLPPRCQPGRIVAPAEAARAEVEARRVGALREQLRVEVAPRQLAHERLRALAATRALDHLERGEAAEVQVRAEPRCAVGCEIVVQAVVVRQTAREPRRQATPSLRLAAARHLGRRHTAREIGERRQPSRLQAAGRRDPPRSPHDRPARCEPPAAPVGREDPVAGRAGGREIAGRNRRDAGQDGQRQPRLGAGGDEAPLARLRVGAHVLAHEDGLRAGLVRDAHRLPHDVTAAHDQQAAAPAQRAIQVGQRIEQECDPVGRAEAREHRAVEHEQRHDALGSGDRGGQRRLVMHAQVAREEHDGRAHGYAAGASERTTGTHDAGSPRKSR